MYPLHDPPPLPPPQTLSSLLPFSLESAQSAQPHTYTQTHTKRQKVSRENGQCISGSADGSCIVWDLNRGVRVLALFEPNVFKGVRYHPDESQYITCGSNHKVQ